MSYSNNETKSNDNRSQAIKLKEFLINYLDKKFETDKVNEITLKDLTEVIASSPFTYFLREYFKLDTRSLLKRLHMFLLTYPDAFKVNYETGMVRVALPDETKTEHLWLTLIDRCCEFLTLCLSLQPSFLIPIKQLHEYALNYAATDIEQHLNDFQFFCKFLNSQDKTFYVEDDGVCLLSNHQKSQSKNFEMKQLEDTQLDAKLLENTQFVYNVQIGLRVLEHIKSNIKVIALDSEGTHLGDNDGVLTLVQISFVDRKLANLDQKTIVDNIRVYIFDIAECTSLISECIVPLLSDENITKVMHDGRNDFLAFQLYFGVSEIKNIFDTSKIYYKLTKSQTNGLHTIYEEITGLAGQNLKPKMRRLYQANDNLWEKRPLSSFLQFYAAFDVLCLLTIYLNLDKRYELKPGMFTRNMSQEIKIYNSSCVEMNSDDETSTNNNKPKKKKKANLQMIGKKKTAEELEEMRKKIEVLEQIARYENPDYPNGLH